MVGFEFELIMSLYYKLKLSLIISEDLFYLFLSKRNFLEEKKKLRIFKRENTV